MSAPVQSSSIPANQGAQPPVSNQQGVINHPTEFHKFWYVGIKEHLAKLVKDYPFVTTTMMFAAAFFGMMNIITFSPSCFIGSLILFGFAATLASATYYSLEGNIMIAIPFHFGSAMNSAYHAFQWAVSGSKVAA